MKYWALSLLVGVAATAQAAPERYALIIGHNAGADDEPELRYAEADASKLYEVLSDLGGFRAENMVLLRGQDSASVRRALIALNDRIRTRSADANVEPMLLVYYSGHADATSLHLGGSELEMSEVEQLVRGSSAHFRMLILDACRSGALTRVKGGTRVPPFPIEIEERLGGEGVVFLTSTSANEDAQESDELKGSFFTHYFVSGLVGAADSNGDGRVVLKEAYDFAYGQTLRASSRTLIGTQHPTFNYEVRGHGDLVMTTLVGSSARRATMAAPPGRTYLVMQSSADGPVVAEIGAGDKRREISVKPGKYFVRSRSADHLLEGEVSVAASESIDLSSAPLTRIDYARLVRKGEAARALVHGPQAGYRFRSVLEERESTPCHGFYAGWNFELEYVSVAPRLSMCRSSVSLSNQSNPTVALREAQELGGELRFVRAFDFPYVSFETGLGLGVGVFQQLGEGDAARDTVNFNASAGWAVIIDLFDGFYANAEAGGAFYGYRIQRGSSAEKEVRIDLVGRAGFGFGKRW